MMAKDANGVSVEYGDWIANGTRIAQVTEINVRKDGEIYRAAYIEWEGKRAKIRYEMAGVATCRVIARANGTLVTAAAALPVKGTVG